MTQDTKRAAGNEILVRIRAELQKLRDNKETPREILIDSDSAYELAVLTDAIPAEGQAPSFDGVPLRILTIKHIQMLAVTKVATANELDAALMMSVVFGTMREMHRELVTKIIGLERSRAIIICSSLKEKHLPFIEASIAALTTCVQNLETLQEKE